MADPCVCGFLELWQMHQNLHELTLLEWAGKNVTKSQLGKICPT